MTRYSTKREKAAPTMFLTMQAYYLHQGADGKTGAGRDLPGRRWKNAFGYLNLEDFLFSKFQMVGSGCCKLTPGGFRQIGQSNMWWQLAGKLLHFCLQSLSRSLPCKISSPFPSPCDLSCLLRGEKVFLPELWHTVWHPDQWIVSRHDITQI